jgi:hypothetical protein
MLLGMGMSALAQTAPQPGAPAAQTPAPPAPAAQPAAPPAAAAQPAGQAPAAPQPTATPQPSAQQPATSPAAQSPAPVGSVATVSGNVSDFRNGAAVTNLKAGDAIYKGDLLQTDEKGSLAVTFDDDTTFKLGPSSTLEVSDFLFEEGGTKNSALFNVVRGSTAFVASLVAKTGDMKIATPTATLGIRGTTGLVDVPTGGGGGDVSIKLYPDANGTVGRIEVFGAGGAQLGTLSRASSGFSIRPGAAGRFAAVPLQISSQQAARDRAFVRQTFSAQQVGRQLVTQRRQQQPGLQRQPNLQRPNQPGQQNRPGQPNRQIQPNRPGQPIQPGQPGRQGQTNQPRQQGTQGQPNRAGQQTTPAQPNRPGGQSTQGPANRAGAPNLPARPGQGGPPAGQQTPAGQTGPAGQPTLQGQPNLQGQQNRQGQPNLQGTQNPRLQQNLQRRGPSPGQRRQGRQPRQNNER